MSDTILLIWRDDYDSMENRDPWSSEVVGFAETDEAAVLAMAALDAAPKYEGRERYTYAQTKFPKFHTTELRRVGA